MENAERSEYVKVIQVTKRFGDETVLKTTDLVLERGKTYGIAGNNGSGKTVLMKCICGFLPVTSGEILVDGLSVGREVDFPKNLGVIIETPGFLTEFTGVKNLEILASLNKKITGKQIRETLCRVGLSPELKKTVAKYSLGMRQRLGIAQAIMEDPDFLVLDVNWSNLFGCV